MPLAELGYPCRLVESVSGFEHYDRDQPPSTSMIWPVMYVGPAAKNRTVSAISSVFPTLCIGIDERTAAFLSSDSQSWNRIAPGPIALIRIEGASSCARLRVIESRAAFEAQ